MIFGADIGGTHVKAAPIDVHVGQLVVENGVMRTAAHLHRSWISAGLATLVSRELGQPVTVVNDAGIIGAALAHLFRQHPSNPSLPRR